MGAQSLSIGRMKIYRPLSKLGIPDKLQEMLRHEGRSELAQECFKVIPTFSQLDLLGYDLVRRYCRVIPVEDLGIAENVDPLIRLVYTHDQKDRVRFFDFLFMTRIGEGFFIASSLDHSEDAGRYLLRKIIEYAAGDKANARNELAPSLLRGSGAMLHPEG